MKTAFQSKNYGFASAICAAAATLAAFAVLPLSVAVSRRDAAGRPPKLVRVYSAAQQQSDGGAKNAGGFGTRGVGGRAEFFWRKEGCGIYRARARLFVGGRRRSRFRRGRKPRVRFFRRRAFRFRNEIRRLRAWTRSTKFRGVLIPSA